MSSEILSAPRLAFSRVALEELAQRRHEPDWLLGLRLRAFEAFERMPMPDQRTEGWRRTSLRGLDLASFDPLELTASPEIVPSNGFVVDLQEALQDPRLAEQIERHFGQIVPPEFDKFSALHYAFFNMGSVVFVPRGKAVDEPIWVTYNCSSAALIHTLVIAEDESDVRLVEDFRGGPGLASGVVEQVLGANAHLRYAHLQRWNDDAWSFSTQRAHLGPDASLRTLNVAVGARMARNNLHVVLQGRGGQADLLGVAATHGRQHVDFETLQDHFGDATRSDLVIHNALRDRSSTNFTGLIRINKSAHQTESSQEQKNILLSTGSKADSDPKLEILNNDVIRCTHGAAVGPVDQEMIFYLASRGLDKATAEQLIVEGFFQSTLKKLEMPAVEAALWAAIDDREHADDAPSE